MNETDQIWPRTLYAACIDADDYRIIGYSTGKWRLGGTGLVELYASRRTHLSSSDMLSESSDLSPSLSTIVRACFRFDLRVVVLV